MSERYYNSHTDANELPRMRPIFHLSIPVADLSATRDFYVETLKATVGRREADWADILLWGHQVTLQLRPKEVLGPEEQGKRHFGVVLSWDDWMILASRLESAEVNFMRKPEVLKSGTPEEQAKLYLQDPSNNVIEIKAYRDVAGVLGLQRDSGEG